MTSNKTNMIDSLRGHQDVYEKKMIHTMTSEKIKVNRLLGKVIAMKSKSAENEFYDVEMDWQENKEYSPSSEEKVSPRVILTDDKIKPIRTIFESKSNLDELRETIKQELFIRQYGDTISDPQNMIKQRTRIIFPMVMLKKMYRGMYLDLSSDEHVKRNLGRRNMTIIANGIDGPFACEILEDAYEGIEDNGEIIDSRIMLTLKEKNIELWEKKMGYLEYNLQSRRIFQIISSLDLQLEDEIIKSMTSRTLSICGSWNQQFVNNLAMESVTTLLGNNATGFFVVKPVKIPHVIQCHIGTRRWAEDYFGTGIAVEALCRLDVYWKPKAQATVDEESELDSKVRSSDLIASATCSVVQGFSLSPSKEQDETIFIDCESCNKRTNGRDMVTSLTSIPDAKQGYISISFAPVNSDGTLSKYKLVSRSDKSIALEKEEARDYEGDDDNDSVKGAGIPLVDTIQKINLLKRKTSDSNLLAMRLDSEIFAWGDNVCNCLGISLSKRRESISNNEDLKHTELHEPDKVLFYPLSTLEVVKSVQCSLCHTLILTSVGRVYSCGDGSDGQLGHGSLESSHFFRHIDSFRDNSNRDGIVLTQISVGADGTSSHSAAIDSKGNLYTWGKAAICGHIGYGPSVDEATRTGIKSKVADPVTRPRRVLSLKDYRALQVSCGGSFTVLRTIYKDGTKHFEESEEWTHGGNKMAINVFSWGLIAGGRLGLGRPEVELEHSYFQVGPRRKKPVRYQNRPKLISKLTDCAIVDISAGKSHALAVSAIGEVFAWGQNNVGQCSVVCKDPSLLAISEKHLCDERFDGIQGTQSPSVWEDVWNPRKISQFGPSSKIKARNVSAGGMHSAVLDTDGKVYTWGGGGQGDCLGHGDFSRYVYGNQAKEDSRRRQQLLASGYASVPNWAVPRVLESLKREHITHVSLGSQHGAAVTESGTLYVWGDQVSQSKKGTEKDATHKHASVSFPSNPNIRVLQELSGKKISGVACGGLNTFAITSGERVGQSLGMSLIDECKSHAAQTNTEYESEENTFSNNSSTVDCAILAGGRRLYCHKVILAHRSSVMKTKIITEERPQDRAPLLEIILYDIPYDVAASLVRFIYTDTLVARDVSSYASTFKLWQAATKFALIKLSLLCESILSTTYNFEVDHSDMTEDEYMLYDLTPSTIAMDLGRAVGDNRWADVRIVTQDTVILAHECILRNSSSYFRTLLAYKDGEGYRNDYGNGERITTIQVPGTHSQLLRVVMFVYTGMLTSDNDQDLLDDLVNAHRYDLVEMKSQCVSAIQVGLDNCVDVLGVALRVQSCRLKSRALWVVSQCIGHVFDNEVTKKKFQDIVAKYQSEVTEELIERIKDVKGIAAILPKSRRELATKWMERMMAREAKMQEKMMIEIVGGKPGEGIFQNFVGVIFAVIGYVVLQRFDSLGPYIPVINVLVLGVITMFLLAKIK